MIKTPTTIKLDSGTEVFLIDKSCTACGCHQAFNFECNCGEVHSDVCYNCGRFVDMKHDPIEDQNKGLDMWWAGRCSEGHREHTHKHPFKEWNPPKRKTKRRR